MRLGLLASGRGTNVGAILAAIDQGRLAAEVALLICDRPAPVMALAEGHRTEVALIAREDYADRASHQVAVRDALLGARVEVVALAGFEAILDTVVVDAFEGRILNIHPSLLPSFGGTVAPEPQAAALSAGVKLAGCTVHIVTTEVDAGPIVAQAAVPVLPDDTVASLAARILEEEHRLYPAVLQWFAEDRVRIEGGRAVVGSATGGSPQAARPSSSSERIRPPRR